MPNTTFTAGTPITSVWLNEVNDFVFNESALLGDAVGDGITDDTVAFQAAIDSLGVFGGVITLDANKKYYIASNLTLKPNVTLRGTYGMVGSPATNISAPYGQLGSAILLNPAATIKLKGGAGVDGVLVYKAGMVFPAADASGFSGTAFTAEGDDCFVTNSMILGFNTAFTSTNYQRANIFNVKIDCVNGIYISNCADIARIDNVHCWPFATIAALGGPTSLQRSGTAFRFTTLGDWNKVTNCFSYGYFRGYWISDCNSMTVHGCGADSTGGYTGQLGFVIDGASTDTRLSFCQAAAQDVGVYISNSVSGPMTQISGLATWACTSHGVLIIQGDVQILGSLIRDTPNGVSSTSANSRIFADKIRFSNISNLPFNPTVSSTLFKIGNGCDYGNFGSTAVTNSNLTIPSIASAAAISLPPSGDDFQITGTTGIGTIFGGWAGRMITLFFTSNPQIFNSTGSQTAIRLNGSATFSTSAGSTLTLKHNGTQWYEVGRTT